jgi:hypothetical protein
MQSSSEGSVWDMQVNRQAKDPGMDKSYDDVDNFEVWSGYGVLVTVSDVCVGRYFLERAVGSVHIVSHSKHDIGPDIELNINADNFRDGLGFVLARFGRNSGHRCGRYPGDGGCHWRMHLLHKAAQEEHLGGAIPRAQPGDKDYLRAPA